MADWDMLDDEGKSPTGADASTVEGFLAAHGLASQAAAIVEAAGAESLDDLKLLDAALCEQVVESLDLKPIPARKLRHAVAACRGDSMAAGSPCGEAKMAASKPPTEADQKNEAPAASSSETALPPPVPPPLQECIVVCLDRSGSMGTPFAEEVVSVWGSSSSAEAAKAVQQRTRMEAVKTMFYAFRDRIDSLGGGTQLGLVQFDNQVDTLLGLTAELARFEAIVDNVERRGQTAIFSAVVAAATSLEPVATARPDVDLRVLVLTDGQNNAGASARDALAAAHAIGATVDAIIVGDRPDAALRKIVTATGGQCFNVRSLGGGFELLENEAVASLRARRGGAPKPPRAATPSPPLELDAIEEKAFVAAPAPRPATAAPVAHQRVRSLATWSAAPPPSCGGANVLRRVAKELRDAAAGELGEGVHLFPSETDLRAWRALVEGPAGSPFAGGVFGLTVQIPDDYPFSPPTVLFETPVYHCNVSDAGSICLDLLKEAWSPALTVPKVLAAVRGLLQDPDPDNALRQWIAELTLAHRTSGGQDTRYFDAARARTQQDAARSVEEAVKGWIQDARGAGADALAAE